MAMARASLTVARGGFAKIGIALFGKNRDFPIL